MAKKKLSMIKKLNDMTKPYNLQVDFAAGKPGEFACKVNLTIMEEIKVLDGKTVQPTHRIVTTSAVGATMDEAKENALTEALQFAGVI
jgi:hypothetical protein